MSDWRIDCCDFRELAVEDGSVALIFTDPPYHEKHLGLFEPLAEWAAKKLKPGGVLLTYSGKYFLPTVLTALGKHLTYVNTLAMLYGAQFGQYTRSGRGSKVGRLWWAGWKPILMYSKGDWFRWGALRDLLQCGPYKKPWHRWQQNLAEAIYYIASLTVPGDLVVDPFSGGATTGQASRLLGRRFLGCDIDPGAVYDGRLRLTYCED